MAAIRRKNVKTKKFVFGIDKVEKPELKVGVTLESVGTKSTQLAGLVLSLIKFELVRRNAYNRWRMYIYQVGLRLTDLVVYLEVFLDDEGLIMRLKDYCLKLRAPVQNQTELLQSANRLKEDLIEKINQQKLIKEFQIHQVQALESAVILK